ncbi:MAG TPA: neutral/alkaline non-lysosomal ceramidase N-terminal domain-containing protein, partial [Chloroflexota bacterium]|nr:neutral/alkaline non-lysosomal ceramidase N-terminal domain-containing protein [Chloroflexota bacterium]
MRARVAKVCITPPVGTWQGGYGARSRACEGIHDDLYARALVLESDDGTTRVAVVSIDIVTLTSELTEATRRRAEAATGIPAGNIALCTSHTHGGPATRAYGETGPQANGEYLPILEQYLAGAVAAATRSLQ